MNETYLQKSDNFRSRKKQMRKLYLSQLATVTLLPMLILFFVWKKNGKRTSNKTHSDIYILYFWNFEFGTV